MGGDDGEKCKYMMRWISDGEVARFSVEVCLSVCICFFLYELCIAIALVILCASNIDPNLGYDGTIPVGGHWIFAWRSDGRIWCSGDRATIRQGHHRHRPVHDGLRSPSHWRAAGYLRRWGMTTSSPATLFSVDKLLLPEPLLRWSPDGELFPRTLQRRHTRHQSPELRPSAFHNGSRADRAERRNKKAWRDTHR